MGHTLGELLQEIIKKEDVSQAALCRGLCSEAAFSRYLNGKRKIDRLLFTVLLQRLGKSPDKFITMLTDEEYEYFEWKQRVCSAQISRDWEAVHKLLQEKEATDQSCNKVLQEQYYLLMQSIVKEKLFRDRAGSLELLEKAIALTVPGFPEQMEQVLSAGKQFLGEQEICAILLWQSIQKNKELAQRILSYFMHYVETHYKDEQEAVHLFPRVAAQYLKLLYRSAQYHECISIAERAIEMMVSTGYASSMEAILTILVQATEQLGLTEKVAKKKVQLAAWSEIMREYQPVSDDGKEDLFLLDVWQEAELLNETISLSRREYGYSQEILSENICTPETLSRIETGKRPPRRKTFHELTEKLELRRDYYYSVIETDDFRALEEKWRLGRLVMLQKWEEADRMLSMLEQHLDMSSPCNRQYIELTHYIIDKRLGKGAASDSFLRLMHILNYTRQRVPEDKNIYNWSDAFWVHPFTSTEISVLMQIAGVLAVEGQTEQAVFLLEKMFNYYEKSRIGLEFHYRIILLLLGRLSAYHGILKNVRKCLEYSERGIEVCIASGNLRVLPRFINNKGDALENLGKKEASLKYYKLAFYCSELMQTSTTKVAMCSYENLIGREVKWY